MHPLHRYQEDDGWCGPAALQMLLLRAGINKTQKEIADDVYDPNWGSSYESMAKYLHFQFWRHGTEAGATTEHVYSLLKRGYGVIANIMYHDETGAGGHYVLIDSYDPTTETYTIFDPSNGDNLRGQRGIYTVSRKDFEKDWYDFANEDDDRHQVPTYHWIAFADLAATKEEPNN